MDTDLIARAEATPVVDLTEYLTYLRSAELIKGEFPQMPIMGPTAYFRSVQEWDAIESRYESIMHAVDVLK